MREELYNRIVEAGKGAIRSDYSLIMFSPESESVIKVVIEALDTDTMIAERIALREIGDEDAIIKAVEDTVKYINSGEDKYELTLSVIELKEGHECAYCESQVEYAAVWDEDIMFNEKGIEHVC